MKTKFPILLMIIVFGFVSCQKEGVQVEYNYYEDYDVISKKLNLPNAPPTVYETVFPSFHHNRKKVFNSDLATLGRVLFYDTNLSKDGSISCASCHKQELGFSDDVAFSKGSGGLETDRNSIALGSVFSFDETYGGGGGNGGVAFFWDNRAFSVQDQSSETFANPKEMDMEMSEVIEAIKEQPYYKSLFDSAFGRNIPENITNKNTLDAISEFINSMANTDSKYDDELAKLFDEHGHLNNVIQRDFSGFSAKENLGKKLYLQNCASCHGETNQLPGKMHANNGLDMEYTDQGMGVFGHDHLNGHFKVPTLRNISLTYPYMHDGRFATLEEVIDHYSNGIQNHPNLDWELKKNGSEAKKFNFTEEDKEAIIAFFDTFTDNKMLTDPKYSDPFK